MAVILNAGKDLCAACHPERSEGSIEKILNNKII